ncbi:MAG: Sapep family Mn(2+)-dependent dipeptidase [Oscillospiraceae bacterium]
MKIDKALEQRIDQWIADHRDRLVRDTCRLVNIESISDAASEIKPFGQGCRDAVDTYLDMGREYGLDARNHDYYVAELFAPGQEKAEKRIGLLAHLDVVPAGEGWTYPPFAATVWEGQIIGRGSQDNKGPAMAAMYTVLCLRDLGIPLRHGLCALAGTNEESGMADVEYYRENCPLPTFILVTDSGFPICYGEKGSMRGSFHSKEPLSGDVLAFSAGTMTGQVPAAATISLKRTAQREKLLAALPTSPDCSWRMEGDSIVVDAKGVGGHISFGGSSRNAAAVLAGFLLENKLLPETDRGAFAFLRDCAGDANGNALGIACEDEESGPLVFGCSLARLEEGRLGFSFSSRCPVSADPHALLEQLEKLAGQKGFCLRDSVASAPHYYPKDKPVIGTLNRVLSDVTGHEWQPQIFGAGTHARKLPNAVAFGPGGLAPFVPPCGPLPEGHGQAHQPDEAQSIDALCLALKVYILGILAIDHLDLERE